MMPTLSFTGRSVVENLHLTVPYRHLEPDAAKSVLPGDAEPRLDGNLFIEGGNLEALKALLPTHGGRVDLIYADPPYNTGNENWVYNDNVRSPQLKKWFEETGVEGEFQGKTVTAEDGERHDKWLCMMWPRLQLMRDLLSDQGAIFVSIDDDEQHRLRAIMDEIFGAENFVCNVVWRKKYSPANDARWFSDMHEFVIVYAKNKANWRPNLLPRTEAQDSIYKNPDNDPRGPWASDNLSVATYNAEYDFPITTPDGRIVNPPKGYCWRVSKDRFVELLNDGRIWFGKDGRAGPRLKRFQSDVKQGRVPVTFWDYDDVGHTQTAKREIKAIFHDVDRVFDTPKPMSLLDRIITIGCKRDSVVLDAFAGTATTAHAVLQKNAEDGGARRFIMIECEEYANGVSAERIRRAIAGVKGAKDPRIAKGYGRTSFTYARLGEEITAEGLLSGRGLPSLEQMAKFTFYRVAGKPLTDFAGARANHLIGETEDMRVYLLYQPDVDFLGSEKAALTRSVAESVANDANGKTSVVFAAARFVDADFLRDRGIRFANLPYDIVQA